ncbi:hypothetical protein [Cohaesibacter haloalkalitolerans]|uniref:hypothetical protein n=1 Tax=Cohaesibacter haloalkalitolerans TaxID=1162980 RepID=UPI000E64957D|nr:hypothetical protein [Cohaesibacter haloalkalitolerans]
MHRFMIQLTRAILLIAAVGLFVLSISYLIDGFNLDGDDVETWPIVASTLLFILALVVLQFFNPGLYNKFNDTVKLIINTRGSSLEEIFDAFKDMDTAWGKPWMGRISTIGRDVIILGPNAEEEYVFIRPLLGIFISVNFGHLTSFLRPGSGEEWRLEKTEQPASTADAIRYSFGSACLMPTLIDRLQGFFNTGRADNSTLGMDSKEEIFLFNEEFKWTGQDFHLLDVTMKPRLTISSHIPCKTFHISDARSGKELFMLTKRLFHIFTSYDLYQGGVKFCRLKRRLVLHHTYFSGDTREGKLELIRMNAMFGSNYQVKLAGKQIGTIARKLNATLSNVVFDNFILSVADPRWLPLMAGMSVMAARQAQREKVSDAISLSDSLD